MIYRCRFEGDRCETKVDQCLSNPCHNGGTCFDRYNKYVCQCLAGFSGLNCHLAISSRVCHSLLVVVVVVVVVIKIKVVVVVVVVVIKIKVVVVVVVIK